MPTARAYKLCPKLVVLPGNYERYEEFSKWMFAYAYDFTPDVERTSIDEGYFDLTANHQKAPIEIAQIIRKAIAQKLKISVSQGLGANKLISQIASKLNKPAAFLDVPHGNEIGFLHPLPNKWLPGIGPKTSLRLNAAGLAHIGQIAGTPIELLELMLGGQAPLIRQFANGIDERPIITESEPQKSYGKQETFAEDVTDEEYVEAVLRRKADELFSDVRAENRSVRTLTVKVRYNDRDEGQCSESMREPTDLETDVYSLLRKLLRKAWSRRVSLRMVSLKLSNVYDGLFRSELSLAGNARNLQSRERLAASIDELRRNKGWSVVLRGHDLRLRDAPRDIVKEQPKLTFQIQIKKSPAAVKRGTYVPLRVRSYYTFLDSTLSPTAIVNLAKQHGMNAVALTDIGNLHGAVEFAQAGQKAGIKPIFGAELCVDTTPLLLFVESVTGYHNLNQILSRKAKSADDDSVAASQRQPLALDQLTSHTDGLIAVSANTSLADLFPGRFYELATKDSKPGRYPIVACPVTHYATPADRLKFDIVQSIRTLTLLRQEHPEKRNDGRLHFRTSAEMTAACLDHPDWIAHSLEIAERCQFAIPFGKPQFPAFLPADGSTPHEFLHKLVLKGLRDRYRERAGEYQAQVEQELKIITAVGYEEYFLVVWGILQDCRQHGIEWITRGSAADSLVCYCLRISDVCPIRFGLYFRRFLNEERMALNKLPDIDVDFPQDRKDDVVDLIFAKYGAEHCAVVGGFSTFQARSAFPRKRASPACSTEAKKASASRWAMDRNCMAGKFWHEGWDNDCPASRLGRTDEGTEHALNDEILRGNQIGKLGVLRFEVGLAIFDHVSFQRAFVVNERRYDLAVARIGAMFQDDEITVQDMPANHGLAAHSQGKGVFGRFVADTVDVHGDTALGVLFARLGKPGRNRTIQRDVPHDTTEFLQRCADAQGAGLARLAGDDAFFPHQPQMSGNGIGAAEAKMRGNFLARGHGTVGLLESLQKIQNLLLYSGQGLHSIYLDTSSPRRRVKRELFTKQTLGLSLPQPAGLN